MSNDAIRLVLAVVVGAHGVGHVLFAPLADSVMKLPASGHSWLLTGVLGDGPAQMVASGVAVLLVGLFLAGAYGIFAETDWWRPLLIVASVASAALIVAYWNGLPTSSAFFGLAFDAVVLVALLVLRWPTDAVVRG